MSSGSIRQEVGAVPSRASGPAGPLPRQAPPGRYRTRQDREEEEKAGDEAINAGAVSDSDESSIWPPDSSQVTRITGALITSLTGEADPAAVSALDLHLRDGSLGRIRRIEGLDRLVNLRQLNLSYNAITKIENLSCLSRSLVELNLAENDISSMEGLFDLDGLQRLNLSGNRVVRIPPEVRRLRSLRTLRLGRNKLSHLDDIRHLGALGQLESLRLDDNPIYLLPDAVPARTLAVCCLAHCLIELDGRPVTDADKAAALEAFPGADRPFLEGPPHMPEERVSGSWAAEAERAGLGRGTGSLRMESPGVPPSAAKSRLANMSDRVDQLTARLLRAEAEADRALLRSRDLARDAARAAEEAGVARAYPGIAAAESVEAVTQSLCDMVVELSGKLIECSSKCEQLERENDSMKSERREARVYAEELITLRKELRSSQSSASLLQAERDDLRAQVRQLESGAEQVRSQWMDASIKEAGLSNTVAQLERDLEQTRAKLTAVEKDAHDNAVLVLQLRRELGNRSVLHANAAGGYPNRGIESAADVVASYFDEPSTESESFLRPPPSSRNYLPHAPGASVGGALAESAQPARSRRGDARVGTNLSELEVAASEAVCSLLLGEIRDVQTKYSKSASGGSSQLDVGSSIEEACLRASLRLVHTASELVRHNEEGGGGDERGAVTMAPLSALGNTAALEKLVSTMKRGSSLGEDLKALSESKDSLQGLVDELTLRAARLEALCSEKDARAKDLDAQAETAKARGLRALGDMQALAEAMQRDREEVDALARSRASLTREIEAANAALSDTRSSMELEARSIEALKARAVTAREEADKWEAEAHKAKSLADEENMRLRTVRAVAGEQVKMLQQELNQIQINLRASRRATGEQEQLRRDLEEEMARRKADGESMQLALARELDEASRKLTSIKTEIRSLRLEADKMSISKRQGEEEYSALEERKLGLLDLIASLEDKSAKKGEAFDRLSAEQEKKIKTLRDTLAVMMSERDILQISVDDIKKQHADLEAVSVSKRRAIDDEIAQAQQQALASIRASRSAVVACEQKKVEAERIDAECRATERRLEELLRGVRDAEIKQDRLQESIRLLTSDKERSENQLDALRKEEDVLRQNLKTSDEIRRRLVSLAEEEASLKLSESKLKSSLSALCKQMENAQHELEEIRSASERERRLGLELRSQRAALEAEGARAEREVAFLREQMAALEQQEVDVRLRISRSVDELSRVQKDLVGLQRKTAEASRADDEMKRKERAAEASIGTLQAEVENAVARLATERAQIEHARSERERVLTEVRAAQDELLVCKQEAASLQAALEKARGEKHSLEAQKTDLIKEMHEMRELNRAEASRSESMSRSYEELERRLWAVREDVQRAEANYAKARELSAAEEERVRLQQRAVADAAAELHAIEGLLQQNSKELHESRVRSLAELGQLSRAKQSMSNHMLLLAEAQNRPFSSSSISGAQSTPSPHPPLEPVRSAHTIRFISGESDQDESDGASSFDPAEALTKGGGHGASPTAASEAEVEIGAALESEMRRLHRKTEEILSRSSRPPM